MKKKIVFGLAIFALMFFFGGVYIVDDHAKYHL